MDRCVAASFACAVAALATVAEAMIPPAARIPTRLPDPIRVSRDERFARMCLLRGGLGDRGGVLTAAKRTRPRCRYTGAVRASRAAPRSAGGAGCPARR